jgi:hypothetical protein
MIAEQDEDLDKIKLDDFEQKILEANTTTDQSTYADPPVYMPMFQVSNRRFPITRQAVENEKHAHWYRQMFAKAIAQLIRELPDSIEAKQERNGA